MGDHPRVEDTDPGARNAPPVPLAEGNGSRGAGGRSVVVIGAGNIGSHLLQHLARSSVVDRVTIVDRDVYEQKNLLSQDIVRSDIGRPKAVVQARRLRRINRVLEVAAIVDDVENV